ncbi:NEP1-interacting protein 1-like protein [Drosera capensis]
MTFKDVTSFFETESTKGLACDLVKKIPKIKITTYNVDASGEKASCSVCLQDFQIEETVQSLPQCYHMFHLPCIDKWLERHRVNWWWRRVRVRVRRSVGLREW